MPFDINQAIETVKDVEFQEASASSNRVAQFKLDYKANKPKPNNTEKEYSVGTRFIFRVLSLQNPGLMGHPHLLQTPVGAKPLVVNYRRMFPVFKTQSGNYEVIYEREVAYPMNPEIEGLEADPSDPIYQMTDVMGLALGQGYSGGPIQYSTKKGPRTEDRPHRLTPRVRLPILLLARIEPHVRGTGVQTVIIPPEEAVRWIEISMMEFEELVRLGSQGMSESGVPLAFNPYTKIPDYNISFNIDPPRNNSTAFGDRTYSIKTFAAPPNPNNPSPEQNAELAIDIFKKIPADKLYSESNQAGIVPFELWFPEYIEAIESQINDLFNEMLTYDREPEYVRSILEQEAFTYKMAGSVAAPVTPVTTAGAVTPRAPQARATVPVAPASIASPLPDDEQFEDAEEEIPTEDVVAHIQEVEAPAPVSAPAPAPATPGATVRPRTNPAPARPPVRPTAAPARVPNVRDN